MGKIFFMILAVFLLLGAFAAPIMTGIKGWRTNDTTDSFVVATGAGVTTANVTLTRDLFQDETSEVITITSNVSGESPVATTYTAATNVLLISALNASESHALVVNYYADTDSTIMGAVGPFLGVLVIGGLLVGIFMTVRGKR